MSKSYKANKSTSQAISKKALIKQALTTGLQRKLKRIDWS